MVQFVVRVSASVSSSMMITSGWSSVPSEAGNTGLVCLAVLRKNFFFNVRFNSLITVGHDVLPVFDFLVEVSVARRISSKLDVEFLCFLI